MLVTDSQKGLEVGVTFSDLIRATSQLKKTVAGLDKQFKRGKNGHPGDLLKYLRLFYTEAILMEGFNLPKSIPAILNAVKNISDCPSDIIDTVNNVQGFCLRTSIKITEVAYFGEKGRGLSVIKKCEQLYKLDDGRNDYEISEVVTKHTSFVCGVTEDYITDLNTKMGILCSVLASFAVVVPSDLILDDRFILAHSMSHELNN